MSTIVLGFALGLNAAVVADAQTMNPVTLAADRQYQQLIYEHRPVVLRRDGFRLVPAKKAHEQAQSDDGTVSLVTQ